MGSPTSILPLNGQFEGQGAFLWADETDGTYNPAPADIIAQITSNFTPQQLKNVHKLESLNAIRASCPQNLNGISPCFAGIGFTNRLNDTNMPATFFTIVNYTIFADSGLSYISPTNHNSDFEKRILPLQWSLDKVGDLQCICLFFLTSFLAGNHWTTDRVRATNANGMGIYQYHKLWPEG